MRRRLAWQGALSDQDQPAAHEEAGGKSEGACSAQDSGGELAALAQHSIGADGGIGIAHCDELLGLWFGGRHISSFGRRHPASSLRQQLAAGLDGAPCGARLTLTLTLALALALALALTLAR